MATPQIGDAGRLVGLVVACFNGHSHRPTKPSKAVRRWDGKTPYAIHPTWCSMTVLTETALSEVLRERLSQALLFHDFKEDTAASLPVGLAAGVETLVDLMTFESSDVEMEQVWTRGEEVLLAKLYDKVSNLLDGSWMSPEKRAKYCAYTMKLCEEVESLHGQLNITKMARAIVA